MITRERALAHGIDPDDPKYHRHADTFSGAAGDIWCPWCRKHAITRPRIACDVAQADYALMDPATRMNCSRCHEAYVKHDGRLPYWCPECVVREEESIKRDRKWQKKRLRKSRSVYRDDGYGCVERVHPTELAMEERSAEPFQ